MRVLADAPSTPDAGVQDEVRALFRDLSSRVTGTPRDMEAHDPIPLSFAIAGTIYLALEIKQELLELRSEAERLLQVRDILKVAGEGMDHTHIAGERAQRNGKVSHP